MTRRRARKKAVPSSELSTVARERLAYAQDAVRALRQAVETGPENSHVQRDLATLLVETADEDLNVQRAGQCRLEAAEILCKLATGGGDEYAFECVEAALDAVPDHATAITLLEQIAPRVGRADAIAPRWLAGLHRVPRGPLARELRLKLARAYVDAGHGKKARACLRPLTRQGDAEALALVATLGRRQRPTTARTQPRDPAHETVATGNDESATPDVSVPAELQRASEPPPAPRPREGHPLLPLLARHGKASMNAVALALRSARSKGSDWTALFLSTLADVYVAAPSDIEHAREPNGSSAHGSEQSRPLLLRIAKLCGEKLIGRDERLRAYGEALALSPSDTGLLERAERAFEAAGRAAELTKKLIEIRETSSDAGLRSTLLRRVAMRLTKENDVDAAISAHQELLSEAHEVDTRRTLVGLLKRKPEGVAELVRELDLLARQVGRAEATTLRLSRAKLLREGLNDPSAAADELQRIADELAPDDLTVLESLAALAEETLDHCRAASAKRRQLALLTDQNRRAALAVELASLYEEELEDDEGAIFALTVWTEIEPANQRPYLRLLPLLEKCKSHEALVKALDTLATLVEAEDEAAVLLVRASRIASKHLGDHDGAWRRLLPRVVDRGDANAEEALREVAKLAGRGRELAELFVLLAQRADDALEQVRRWMDAAHEYEALGASDKALEAALRALSKDMSSPTMLDEVDRLAAATRAWARLCEVYDGLVRHAEMDDTKVRMLARQARLLEHQAHDPAAAFVRMELATQIDPTHDGAYAEATRLAYLTIQHERALLIRERRAAAVADTRQKLEALLSACAVCQRDLSDRPRAMGYLASAVTLAGADETVLLNIEGAVKAFDAEERPVDGPGLTSALAEVLKQCAEDADCEPSLSGAWLLRAADLTEHSLGDVRGAFDAIERAASLNPTNEIVLDRLERAAVRADAIDGLIAHYQRAVDGAIDCNTASISLRRLGKLLDDKLARPELAAEAYRQLVMLQPNDLDASSRLLACLKAANRFNDLLLAIDRHLSLVTDEEQRVSLLREAAETWETSLHNRFEALDLWRKIGALRPDDQSVKDAISRLEKKPPPDERTLLESGDLVVALEGREGLERNARVRAPRAVRGRANKPA